MSFGAHRYQEVVSHFQLLDLITETIIAALYRNGDPVCIHIVQFTEVMDIIAHGHKLHVNDKMDLLKVYFYRSHANIVLPSLTPSDCLTMGPLDCAFKRKRDRG